LLPVKGRTARDVHCWLPKSNSHVLGLFSPATYILPLIMAPPNSAIGLGSGTPVLHCPTAGVVVVLSVE
jgi:hypothetical protein